MPIPTVEQRFVFLTANVGLLRVSSTALSGDLGETLYVHDYQPTWFVDSGYSSGEVWETEADSVQCGTTDFEIMSHVSCRTASAVGSHQCGYDSGYILYHTGATLDLSRCGCVGGTGKVKSSLLSGFGLG